MRTGMLLESGRHDHDCAQVHWLSPEAAEQLALDAEMLDVLGVLRRLDWRNLLGEGNANCAAAGRIDVDSLRLAHQVARLLVPLLAFSHIGRKLHGMPIGAMVTRINIEHC